MIENQVSENDDLISKNRKINLFMQLVDLRDDGSDDYIYSKMYGLTEAAFTKISLDIMQTTRVEYPITQNIQYKKHQYDIKLVFEEP